MVLPKNGKVAVLGAGLSGLSYAHFLGTLRPDLNITILEKNNRVGGWINTQKATSATINKLKLNNELNRTLRMEKGPRTLRGVSPGTLIITDLLQRMGKLNELRGVPIASAGNKKYLLGKDKYAESSNRITGKLVPVPGGGNGTIIDGFSQSMNFIATEPGMHIIKGIIRDVMFKQDGEDLNKMTVARFFERHFGKDMANESISGLLYGIYAADIDDLSINCVFPTLVDIEKKYGSIVKGMIKRDNPVVEIHPTVSKYLKLFGGSELDMESLSKLLKKFPMLAFQSGLSGVTDALRDKLPSNVNIQTSCHIDQIGSDGVINVKGKETIKYDHIRSTIPTLELSNMVNDKVGSILAQFPYTSITVANILIKRANIKEAVGFGFLIPKACLYKETPLIGVIFDSDVEEHSVPLFPNGEIPSILNSKNKTESTKEVIDELSKNISSREGEGISEECTKMTFMFQVPRNGKPSTPAAITSAIKDTLNGILGIDIDMSEVAIECITHQDAIPLYDTEFQERREQVLKKSSNIYGDRLSLGGTAFAPGVGIPDAVIGSLDAVSEVV